MITIVIEAGQLPDNTKVRKVTGINNYIIKRIFKIYEEVNGAYREIDCGKGTIFLVSDSGVNCVKDSTRVAIDFENTEEAIVFLETLTEK